MRVPGGRLYDRRPPGIDDESDGGSRGGDYRDDVGGSHFYTWVACQPARGPLWQVVNLYAKKSLQVEDLRVISRLAQTIGRALRSRRAIIMREDGIHDAIAHALRESGIAFEREVRLNSRDRLDFLLTETGTAIEVKKGSAGIEVLPQLGRYFESERVTGAILVAMRINDVPPNFGGKPIASIPLWKFLL